jgi:CheY-like chemotaxis protein
VPVVLLTGSQSSERVDEARAAGAVRHVMKSRAADELVPALVAAAAAPDAAAA